MEKKLLLEGILDDKVVDNVIRDEDVEGKLVLVEVEEFKSEHCHKQAVEATSASLHKDFKTKSIIEKVVSHDNEYNYSKSTMLFWWSRLKDRLRIKKLNERLNTVNVEVQCTSAHSINRYRYIIVV